MIHLHKVDFLPFSNNTFLFHKTVLPFVIHGGGQFVALWREENCTIYQRGENRKQNRFFRILVDIQKSNNKFYFLAFLHEEEYKSYFANLKLFKKRFEFSRIPR